MADYLYIHIPFCVKKCVYCDFFSVSYDESTVKAYVDALCKELSMIKTPGDSLKTVYVGGGTPTLLPAASCNILFGYLRDNFPIAPDAEITVEANPGTTDESKIELLLSLGVNRLSVGVQSFNDKELATLGRIHSSDEALESIVSIKKAGLKNFSIDLMYGIPGQTKESWRESLTKAAELSPTHISAYELTLEENTPISFLITSGTISMLKEDVILDMYDHAIVDLAGHGYEHYEISNFALPGYQCIHNLNYWNRGEYIGIGAGAHSFVRGVRSKNIADINNYIAHLGKGVLPESDSSAVSPEEALKEMIFLGLRKTEGLNIRRAGESGLSLLDASGELVDEGYLKVTGEYLSLTRKGLVVSNTVIVKLFEKLGL
jgi:oxygen-independent coproporphyrinogen III oxidase